FVVVDRVTCCSTIFAVTDTSGMAAPLASLTYPAMLPVAIWAAVGETARVSVNRAMTGKSQHGKSIPANRRLVRFGCKTIYCPLLDYLKAAHRSLSLLCRWQNDKIAYGVLSCMQQVSTPDKQPFLAMTSLNS